jgi:hypothetical protein
LKCRKFPALLALDMAYIYAKPRSPFWYVQYIDSDGRKHDKSTGFRRDDPNETLKAKARRAELDAKEYHRVSIVNSASWDSWVPKFFDRHCKTERTRDAMMMHGSGWPFGFKTSASIRRGR